MLADSTELNSRQCMITEHNGEKKIAALFRPFFGGISEAKPAA